MRALTAVRQRVDSWNADMREASANRRLGTRRRSGAMAVAGLGALGGLFLMVSQNVLAVQFTSANQSYKVYTDRVVGQYAAGYLNAQDTQDGADRGVAQVGFKTADLYGMCVVAEQTMPAPMGKITLVMTGGEVVDGTPSPTGAGKISANQLYLASNQLAGDGKNIERMTLGQSADTLTMDDITTHRGTPGAFGLQAKVLDIGSLKAESYGIDLQGSINLPNLKIRVVPGGVDTTGPTPPAACQQG
ncbi:DUF6230 family protein [Nocardioides speluncae]|uniref:DUF6230 family protein n=1 Tax=Nocardioides speluncae TaxID=2670337 RepID=UPI000D69B789|nr:DUF6230 family protein [Nocardioides speluncae]